MHLFAITCSSPEKPSLAKPAGRHTCYLLYCYICYICYICPRVGTPAICFLFDAESRPQAVGGRWAGLNILRPLLGSWVVGLPPWPYMLWSHVSPLSQEKAFFYSKKLLAVLKRFNSESFHLTWLPVWVSPHMGSSWPDNACQWLPSPL